MTACEAGPSLSRRTAFKLAGAAALAGGGALVAPRGAAQTVIPTFDRLDHVYFMLNIHWFQAGIYSRALTGQGLSWDLLGLPPGTPPVDHSFMRISFTDPMFRDFVSELLETEIAQIRTLMAIASSLDGPGKIANLRAPEMWFGRAAILNDGFSKVFAPLYPNWAFYTPHTEENILVVMSHIRDIAVTAYQTVVSKVPGDTVFPAFMAVQAHGAAILRDMIYERATAPGSTLLDIIRGLARRGTESLDTVLMPQGLASNLVPADDRGRAPTSSYATVLGQLVGGGQEKSLFFRFNFVGRINTITLNILG